MKCGGVIDPNKKYCDYCEREIKAKGFFNSRNLNLRLLIEGKNGLINFNDIMAIETTSYTPTIDCTTLEDDYSRRIVKKKEDITFDFTIFDTARGRELFSLLNTKPMKTRVEMVSGFTDKAWEMTTYVGNIKSEIQYCKYNIKLIAIDEMKSFDSCIPNNVLEVLRCPNCGAPIKSRICACDFCGGWSEVEW